MDSNSSPPLDITSGPKSAANIDYEQRPLRYGTLQYQTVQSNQYGSAINLGASQVPVVFNLPTEVMNFGKSKLRGRVILPGQAGFYINTHCDCRSEIAHIQFYGANNVMIADFDNYAQYTKTAFKQEISMDDFLTRDEVFDKPYPSNTLNNVAPAIRADPTGTNSTFSSSQNYREQSNIHINPLNTDADYSFELNFADIKNTILSLDKNYYFGQIMYIKIFFQQLNKIAYITTSPTNPNVGATDYVPLTNATITDLQLFLAIETNPDERMKCISMTERGFAYIIPSVQSYNNTNSGNTQSIQIQCDSNQGRSLVKMYHSVFNNSGIAGVNSGINNLAYDCANNSSLPLTFQKVQTYWTNLNSRRVQNITLQCTDNGAYAYTDYLNIKDRLKGSMVENLDIFQYNWCHCDDWSSFENEYVFDNGSELISGVPMGPTPLTWSFNGQTMASQANANSFIHYTWGIFTKRLSIMNNVITLG